MEEITYTNPDLLFLFRNGVGESRAAMNETLTSFGKVAKDQVGSLLTGTFICMGMIGVVYLVCLAIAIPKIFQIQKRTSSVWITLFSVPMGTLVELRRKSLDRLRIYHSVDVDNEESRRISTKQRSQLKDPIWKTLIALMLLFAGFTLGFYGYIYAAGIKETTDLLISRSSQVELIYQNKVSLLIALLWSGETSLVQSPQFSVYSLEPEWQLITHPDLEFTSAYDQAKQEREKLRSSLLNGYLPIDSTTKTVMFDSIISDTLLLRQGLLAAERDYLEALNMYTRSPISEEYAYLIRIEREMQDIIDQSSKTMVNKIDDSINRLANQTIVMFALYCASSVGFYFMITLPILEWVNFRIKQTWRLTSLIPNDVMQNVLKS